MNYEQHTHRGLRCTNQQGSRRANWARYQIDRGFRLCHLRHGPAPSAGICDRPWSSDRYHAVGSLRGRNTDEMNHASLFQGRLS
jgi:hypothetical protein